MPADDQGPASSDLLSIAGALRHDLRTPLNQIIGYAELLEEDANGELRADLRKIHGAARNVLATLDNGLDRLVRAAGADPGRAARVTAALPANTAAEAEAAGGSEGQLLVVDDNEMNADMLSRRLTRRGFTVDVASDGTAALRMVEERAYDAILLDIMMPGISGLEVLRQIRSRHSAVDLPVIMATAREGNDAVVESLNLGANDYVKKPIDLSVLLARIDAHLSLKRATAEVKRLADQLGLRNRFIQSVFGRYMSDQIVEKLLGAPEALTMGGELRSVTILMSDLRGFSSLSERLGAPEVIALLNDYLATMTEIILRHGGTIDEFIGDAILVLFGAPLAKDSDALRAVACAVEMQYAMKALNQRNMDRGLPQIEMGIGVNTGEVVVGNIGSERRAKYGVVGRNVNLASRIEAFTVGGQILISDATLAAAGPTVSLRRSVAVFPKGSKAAMLVHDVAGVGGEYGLFLEEDQAPLCVLSSPVKVSLVPVDGVHVRAEPQEAAIVKLSRQRAAVAVAGGGAVATKLATVRLTFVGVDSSDSYAKVIDAEGDLLLHFTSVPPTAATKIEQLLAAETRKET